jgi:4-amino-4-deoxy-L-arabinose transferase-like glycosyltransferase
LKNCSNCRESLTGQARFCPACGQSVKGINRPWREVAGELATELLDLDGRMLGSLRALLTRPGFLSLEYVNGRRASHTSPLRMYLVISLVFFFVLPMILPKAPDSVPAGELDVEQYSRAMFLLLPVFALVLKAFYRGVYYLAHLVFTVYLFSVMFIVFGLMLSIETAADRYFAVMIMQLVLLVYILGYGVIALRVNYRESWLKSTLKFIALLFIFMAMATGVIVGVDQLSPPVTV